MRVSVITPAYNSAPWLPKAIESALAQTVPPAEIIVVDDGSTDNTAEVVRRYEPAVRYLHQENRGVSAARNHAMAAATGDWIAMLDADDYWLPFKLERQLQALKPGAVLCYGRINHFNDDGPLPSPDWLPAERLWPIMLSRAGLLFPSVCMFDRRTALAIGGFREDMVGSEEWEFFVRMHRQGRFVSVDEPLAMYRVVPGSLSNRYKMLLGQMEKLIPTLVADFSWPRSALHASKIRSYFYTSAAISAREAGRQDEAIGFAVLSVLHWPLASRGAKVLAVEAANWLRRTVRHKSRH